MTETNLVYAGRALLNKEISKIEPKLNEFCIRRGVESGLLTRMNSGTYRFSKNNVENNKILGRIRPRLHAYIKKFLPFFAFSTTDIIEQDQKYNIRLKSTAFTPHILEEMNANCKDRSIWGGVVSSANEFSIDSIKEWPSIKNYALMHHPEVRLLNRYASFLNYLCRKYRLPIHLDIMAVFYISSEDNPSSAEDKKKKFPKNGIDISLDIRLRKYTPVDLDLYNSVVGNPLEFDKFCSKESNFSYSSIHRVSSTDKIYKCYPEKIYLHLEKCLKTLLTLSRKMDYGFEAFTIRDRPAEGS